MDRTIDEFAAEVGTTGPVAIAGSGSRRGGRPDVRTVKAPAGVVRVDPAEMVVECGAATPVDELHAVLAEHGQTTVLPPGGTVGGALAVGRSDITRLAHGPLRDVLLQARFVSASGQVTVAGGPTVKNVSGFDLCRLLVGSWGTLGFLATILLRTRPLPACSGWYVSVSADPLDLLRSIHRPVSILWDGTTTWVRLDGAAADVERDASEHGLEQVDGPPPLPSGGRWSLPPAQLTSLAGSSGFVAEIGVGVVHHTAPAPTRPVDPVVAALHRRIKQRFDPEGRLNPGLDVLDVA